MPQQTLEQRFGIHINVSHLNAVRITLGLRGQVQQMEGENRMRSTVEETKEKQFIKEFPPDEPASGHHHTFR